MTLNNGSTTRKFILATSSTPVAGTVVLSGTVGSNAEVVQAYELASRFIGADPAALTAALIRCPTVTPAEGGALTLLEGLLMQAGFT